MIGARQSDRALRAVVARVAERSGPRRQWTVERSADGFVAGEETAVLNALTGGGEADRQAAATRSSAAWAARRRSSRTSRRWRTSR